MKHRLVPSIIAETSDILAIAKPAGLITHRDGRNSEPSVAEWLIARYPELAAIGEWVSPQGEHIALGGLVHRLDRGTSGVLLAAKTQEAYEYLKGEFKARRVEKKYLAYVHGQMKKAEGRIVAEIARSSTPPKKWYAKDCAENAKRAAITDWRVLEKLEDATLLELYPRTGRTHQIRVHLSHIGHPVVGDLLYARDYSSVLQKTGTITEERGRMYLHATSITLTLPSGERATFEAPLPPDFPR